LFGDVTVGYSKIVFGNEFIDFFVVVIMIQGKYRGKIIGFRYHGYMLIYFFN